MNKKKKKRIHEWLRKHNVVRPHVCECGCKNQVVATEAHYNKGKKVPKYIQGHNLKDKSIPKPTARKRRNIWNSLSDEEKQKRLDNLQKFESGKDNPNWGGGRFKNTSGYMLVLDPDHPFSVNGYVLEHRLVVEQWLRENEPNSQHLVEVGAELYLKPGRVVHHIDEVKDNNLLSNLYVFNCSADHVFWHKSSLTTKEKLRILGLEDVEKNE